MKKFIGILIIILCLVFIVVVGSKGKKPPYQCKDGTVSYSRDVQGPCAGHGGKK